MLYLLHGTDVLRSREKLHALVGTLLQKRPDAFYFHVTDDSIGDYALDELIRSQGLFEQKYIVVFDGVLRDAAVKDALVPRLEECAQADHLFVFLEGALDAKTIKKFETYAEQVQEFSEAKREKPSFNVFSLTDALGRRNKKDLWTLYQKAKAADIADEEIHSILFWQVKSMLLASEAKDAKEAGLNPFVYKKSLGFLSRFTKDELAGLSGKLARLSHDARRGIHGFDTALERFILAL